jgi:chlorobactene glucosyltransferase
MTLIITIYVYCLCALAVYCCLLCSLNILDSLRLTAPPEITGGALVSVCIPARNEEDNIGRCLEAFLHQTYQNYEILVLDDNSTDGTAAIVHAIAAQNPRVRYISGKALPADWYGKAFACQQLLEEAAGEVLLFTDADTFHKPSSVAWSASNIKLNNADFISGYLKQNIESFGELITVPLMFFLTGFFVPVFLNRRTRIAGFSPAIGQYIAVRRDTFLRVGGFEAVKKKTSEDIYLGRHFKKAGCTTMFLRTVGQAECRMYKGWRASRDGIGKNIFDFFGKRTIALFGVAIAVAVFLFGPFPFLLYTLWSGGAHLLQVVAANLLYTASWMILFRYYRINPLYGLIWPILYVNLFYMAFWSWFRTISGRGFVWKGRRVS